MHAGCALKRTAQHARCWHLAVAQCCNELHSVATSCAVLQRAAQCCNELDSVATSCAVLQRAAQCCSELHSVATSCAVLQRAAQCCNELRSVATCAVGPAPAPRCSTARLARTTAATRQTADFARAAPIICRCNYATQRLHRCNHATQRLRSATDTVRFAHTHRAIRIRPLRCAAAHLGRVGRELLELLGPDLKPQRRTCVCVCAAAHLALPLLSTRSGRSH
jgi:hypothetical protein